MKTEHYSGKLAKSYDKDRQDDPKWKFENLVFSAALESVRSEIKTVLDAPVGSGRFLMLYGDLRVTGVDISEDMLAVARNRGTKAKLELRDLVNDEIVTQFDLVVCFRFLNLINTEEMAIALKRLLSAARKYAIFTLRTIHDDCDQNLSIGRVFLHRESEALAVIDEAGFEIVDRQTYADTVPGNYDVFFCKRQSRRRKASGSSNLVDDNPESRRADSSVSTEPVDAGLPGVLVGAEGNQADGSEAQDNS